MHPVLAVREDPAHVSLLLLEVGAVLVLVTAMALLFAWILQQAQRPGADAKRLRSTVLFRAVVPVEAPAGLGALLTPILDALRRAGLETAPTVADDDAVHVPLELEHDQFVLHLRSAPDGFVAQLCDRAAANRPAGESRTPPVDRPRARKALLALDEAVRRLPTVSDVRWHKREKFDAGDLSTGSHDVVE